MNSKSILLSFLKPIRINVLGGNFKFRTHPHLQVDLLPFRMEKELELIPKLIEHHDHIEISGQSIRRLMRQAQKVDIDILVPENAHVQAKIGAGVAVFDGKFADIDINVKVGEVVINPNRELKHLETKVGVGSIKFYSPVTDKIVYKKNTFLTKKFRYNDQTDVSLCLSLIGGLDINERKR